MLHSNSVSGCLFHFRQGCLFGCSRSGFPPKFPGNSVVESFFFFVKEALATAYPRENKDETELEQKKDTGHKTLLGCDSTDTSDSDILVCPISFCLQMFGASQNSFFFFHASRHSTFRINHHYRLLLNSCCR